jgi:ABC-type Fe3+-citrate transport system substrate-binding protein
MFSRFSLIVLVASLMAMGCKDSSTKSNSSSSTGTISTNEPTFRVRTDSGDTVQGPMPRVVTPSASSVPKM